MKGGRLKVFFALLSLAFALNAAPPSLALDVIAVKAEGSAIKDGGEAEAKKKATENAFRQAVMEALKTVIREEGTSAEPESVASSMEAEISPNPLRYILNFRMLSEGWTIKEAPPLAVPEGAAPQEVPAPSIVEIYTVWVEARVDAALLKEELGRVASLGGGQGLRDISIVILDVTDYDSFRSLYSSLGRITMLRDLSYSSFFRGRIVLKARTAAAEAALTERIKREAGENYITFAGGGDSIIIKAAPAHPM